MQRPLKALCKETRMQTGHLYLGDVARDRGTSGSKHAFLWLSLGTQVPRDCSGTLNHHRAKKLFLGCFTLSKSMGQSGTRAGQL